MGYHPATKKICALITSMLCLPIFISANVYEGSIDKYSIWITFDSQTPDGIINGTYFYCSTGRDIQLEGTKNGSVISFTESDKNGNVTGKFSLTIKGIELSGTWINGNGKKKFAVKACESTTYIQNGTVTIKNKIEASMGQNDNEWTQKGSTLSHQSAMKEFKLTEKELFDAARQGELQYRENNIYGNPFLRLLRSEVERYVKQKYGSAVLKEEKTKNELRNLDKELRKLKKRIVEIENRKKELERIAKI
jgi:hypothetical protein